MNFNPVTDIPSLPGKIIIVTGGTDGLGKESVRELSLHSPAHIYFTGRNKTKAQNVIKELDEEYPHHAPVSFLKMDLSSLKSVKATAKEFLTTNDRLDILMCNAGGFGRPAMTEDGYEQAFGVNHLAHALFIQLLLPVLRKTAAQPASDVRVISLASVGEKMAPKNYTFHKMKTDLASLGMMTRYGQSKLAQIHYTSILAHRYPKILFTSVHPGNVVTNIHWDLMKDKRVLLYIMNKIGPLVVKVSQVEEGAKGQLWCATGPRDLIKNGAFYWPLAVLDKGSAKTRDVKMAGELSKWTEEQLRPWLDAEKSVGCVAVVSDDVRSVDIKKVNAVSVGVEEVHV